MLFPSSFLIEKILSTFLIDLGEFVLDTHRFCVSAILIVVFRQAKTDASAEHIYIFLIRLSV